MCFQEEAREEFRGQLACGFTKELLRREYCVSHVWLEKVKNLGKCGKVRFWAKNGGEKKRQNTVVTTVDSEWGYWR